MSFGAVFLICALIIVLLEPKLIGALIYWAFLVAVGFVGFYALLLFMSGY